MCRVTPSAHRSAAKPSTAKQSASRRQRGDEAQSIMRARGLLPLAQACYAEPKAASRCESLGSRCTADPGAHARPCVLRLKWTVPGAQSERRRTVVAGVHIAELGRQESRRARPLPHAPRVAELLVAGGRAMQAVSTCCPPRSALELYEERLLRGLRYFVLLVHYCAHRLRAPRLGNRGESSCRRREAEGSMYGQQG